MEARLSCKWGHIESECAEVMGIMETPSWITGQQLSEVTIVSDCLVIVQAIRGSSRLISHFGRLIQEYKVLLKELKGYDT